MGFLALRFPVVAVEGWVFDIGYMHFLGLEEDYVCPALLVQRRSYMKCKHALTLLLRLFRESRLDRKVQFLGAGMAQCSLTVT